MSTVVLTVKYSYVASTKYTRQGVVEVSHIVVIWPSVFIKLVFFQTVADRRLEDEGAREEAAGTS